MRGTRNLKLLHRQTVSVPLVFLLVPCLGWMAISIWWLTSFVEVRPQSTSAVSKCFFYNDAEACSVFTYDWAQVPSRLTSSRVRGENRRFQIYTPDDIDSTTVPKADKPSKKINVLYFTNRKEYLEKMDRYYYDEVKIASSHSGLLVRMWGPGWQGYNKKLTSSENILNAFPGIQFDIIYTKTWHYNVTSPTVVVIHGTGDCHNHKCLKDEYYPTHADAITYRYAGLVLEFSRPEQWHQREHARIKKLYPALNATIRAAMQQPMPFYFHSPDCADEELLHPYSHVEQVKKTLLAFHPTRVADHEVWASSRPNLIKLIGSTKGWLYPLRKKVYDAIQKGQIKNARIHKHAGYVLPAKKNSSGNSMLGHELGLFDSADPYIAHHKKNQEAWANTLKITQICVFDSSVVRKAIRKYTESFMAGCVVAADIPLEMEELFKDVVIPLNAKMSVNEINEILQEYLSDKERLTWMAMEAFKRARMHWTCKNKVDRLLRAAELVVSGEHGYWFPFGFSATCRKFGNSKKYISDWCQ